MIKETEAKEFIGELREKMLSAMEVFSLTERKSDERLDKLNPRCHLAKKQINEEDLFKKLRSKLEQKKKEEYKNNLAIQRLVKLADIQILNDSLHSVSEVPLYKIKLAENLGKGADWLLDEILLSTEKFGKDVSEGAKAADRLFPAKSYEISQEAAEFINFIDCEKEDYRAFAIEFMKEICDIK